MSRSLQKANMPSCSVPGCHENNSRSKVKRSYHQIPKDPGLKKLWLWAIARKQGKKPEERFNENTVWVCSLHFQECDFIFKGYTSRKQLREGAVPSVFDFKPAPKRRKLPSVRHDPPPPPTKKPCKKGCSRKLFPTTASTHAPQDVSEASASDCSRQDSPLRHKLPAHVASSSHCSKQNSPLQHKPPAHVASTSHCSNQNSPLPHKPPARVASTSHCSKQYSPFPHNLPALVASTSHCSGDDSLLRDKPPEPMAPTSHCSREDSQLQFKPPALMASTLHCSGDDAPLGLKSPASVATTLDYIVNDSPLPHLSLHGQNPMPHHQDFNTPTACASESCPLLDHSYNIPKQSSTAQYIDAHDLLSVLPVQYREAINIINSLPAACKTAIGLIQSLPQKYKEAANLLLGIDAEMSSASHPDMAQILKPAKNVQPLFETEVYHHDPKDHDYVSPQQPLVEQHKVALMIIRQLQAQVQFMRKETCFYTRLSHDPKMCQFYTGFTSYFLLMKFYEAIEPTAERMITYSQYLRKERGESETMRDSFGCSIALVDQYLITLKRLKLGSFELELAYDNDVNDATINRLVITWINYLYVMLGSSPLWPSKEQVKRELPDVFKPDFEDTRIILDCTEIWIEKPSSLVLNSEFFSNYKHHTTMKALVGIMPSGAVTFVSELYPGSNSDVAVTKDSGILDLIEKGDKVMVDKGFTIDKLLEEKQADLVIPPFLKAQEQFPEDQAKETKDIARVRVHVERAIRRVKCYHIFDRVIPLSMAGIVNQMWAVCCLLTNFHGPLLSKHAVGEDI